MESGIEKERLEALKRDKVGTEREPGGWESERRRGTGENDVVLSDS